MNERDRLYELLKEDQAKHVTRIDYLRRIAELETRCEALGKRLAEVEAYLLSTEIQTAELPPGAFEVKRAANPALTLDVTELFDGNGN